MSHQDFEKYAEQKSFNYKVPEKFRENFDRCVAKLKSEPVSLKILDFGCGDGKHFHFYLNAGFLPENIYGVEISKKRIERCRSIGWQNTFFIENEKMTFANDKFDLITMAEVIEHIPTEKIEKVFLELTRVLKKNGILIITTPNYPIKRFYDIYDAFRWGKWIRLRDDPTHANHYSMKKLRNFLDKRFSSFEIVPYKHGFLFDKCKNNFFLHKMLAICSDKK